MFLRQIQLIYRYDDTGDLTALTCHFHPRDAHGLTGDLITERFFGLVVKDTTTDDRLKPPEPGYGHIEGALPSEHIDGTILLRGRGIEFQGESRSELVPYSSIEWICHNVEPAPANWVQAHPDLPDAKAAFITGSASDVLGIDGYWRFIIYPADDSATDHWLDFVLLRADLEPGEE